MSLGKIYDVLIVGAGPVGLASAIALRRRGINNIIVIDQARSFRRVGQIVDLLPNGLKALKYIDEKAYQQIKSTGLEFIQTRRQNSEGKEKEATKKIVWHHKNLQGEIVRSTRLDFDFWFNRYGEGRTSIPWHSLQTELRNLLPQEIVKANRRCVSIAQSANSVTVNCVSNEIATNPFAHWENRAVAETEDKGADSDRLSERQIQAKLVVAADGINSTVRQLVYASSDLSQWAKPRYSEFAAIGCLQVDRVSDEIMQQLEDKYFQGDMIVTLRNDAPDSTQHTESPRLILIRKGKNSLGYLFHFCVGLDSIQNKSPEAIIDLAADTLAQANFPDVFVRVVKLSDPAKLIHRPYYLHPANIPHTRPIWSDKRLVLVGDAAHGMPPFAAQGANQGLEDAAVIGTAIANIINRHALDDLAVIQQQFARYEQFRRPVIAKVQEATMYNHSWSQERWSSYGDEIYSHEPENLCRKLVLNR